MNEFSFLSISLPHLNKGVEEIISFEGISFKLLKSFVGFPLFAEDFLRSGFVKLHPKTSKDRHISESVSIVPHATFSSFEFLCAIYSVTVMALGH